MKLWICKDSNFDFLACASWQYASASNILITLSRINVELDDELQRFLKLALFGSRFDLLENFLHSELFIHVLDHLSHRFSPTFQRTSGLHHVFLSLLIEKSI